jgi:L-lactate dehydrogenase complex protein LldF
MLTDECGFRAYMAGVGIEVIETDLGERIQQLDHEEPAHVIGPAIHKTRFDVPEVFARNLGSDPNDTDIPHLASVQREATRPLILKADAGMTGCNFAVAETGTVSYARTKATRISLPTRHRCTSPRLASRRLFLGSNT